MRAIQKFVLPLWAAFCLSATGAPAAGKLEVDLIPLVGRARTQAPIPVEARFTWNSTHILEGRLEMEFREGNRVLGRYRTGDLALTGGDQRFRMLLPPLAPSSDSQVEVRMRFATGGNAVAIDPTTLFVPAANERSLVVGWCDAETAAGQASSDLVQYLRVERFAPPSDEMAQRILMTSVARLAPGELPAQPLAYAAFDVMVLTAEALPATNERQLQALARWVRGGGSLCVLVNGGLQPQHLRFLNQLAESTTGGPAFLADAAGNLLPAQKGILYLRSGVGRSVIVPPAALAGGNLDASACRKIAAFLWKMRSKRAQAIADRGSWETPAYVSMPTNPVVSARQPFRSRSRLADLQSYSVQPTDLGANLMSLLMPKTVRLIPFSALLGMLALFVLLIGPADYFVLGYLRRRRLTWALFPTVSIAFTIATVLMANHYLGLRDQRCSLVVVDLARDGTALRWNRYELVFAARDKQSVTEVKDALWAPLPVQRTYNVYADPYSRYGEDAGGEADPAWYGGVLPVHYQASLAIRQWRPEMSRVLSFEPPPVPMPPDWPAVEEAWPDLRRIRAKLSERKPFSGDLYAIAGHNSVTADRGSTEIIPDALLNELCAGHAEGLQSLVSQVSPTGGGNFEDAPALDAATRDAVLVMVTRSGDDVVVYRRFFYGN